MQGIKNLTQGPINRQLFNLAMPIMATSFIQMAYSLTDMAWVGRLGSEAVAAIGSVGILTWMSGSISLLNKVGSEVSVGQSIGAQSQEDARSFASHNITIALIISICWGTLLFIFAEPIIRIYELEDHITANAIQYLRIISTGLPFIFLSAAFTGIYNAAGRSKVPFFISGTGLILNIILDPLMIFGIGPFPQMGVAGAATATVLAQAIVTAMFLLAARREMTVFPQIHIFQASQWRAWAEILKIGLPVSIQSMFFSGLSMILARLVAGWGDAAIAAQKVGSQIESISYTTAEGFATAVNAFIAQNFGAGRMERIRKGYWTAIGMIVVWSGFTTLMLVVFPVPLFRIFIPDDHVLQTGVSYLRIMGYSQILMCLEITSSGAFQGLGRPMPPTLAGIIGNAARIPLAVFLSATVLGLDGVWWSISISSIAKGIVVFTWFVVILHRYTHRQAQGVDGLE